MLVPCKIKKLEKHASLKKQSNKYGWAIQIVDAKINTLESEDKCSPSTESEPNVPVNLTWNWQGRKQSQIRERIGWDSEYLSYGCIGKLCRYYGRQKDIKGKRVVNERIGRISRYTKRHNRLWTANHVCMTRSKLRMCSSDDVKLKTDLNRLLW